MSCVGVAKGAVPAGNAAHLTYTHTYIYAFLCLLLYSCCTGGGCVYRKNCATILLLMTIKIMVLSVYVTWVFLVLSIILHITNKLQVYINIC